MQETLTYKSQDREILELFYPIQPYKILVILHININVSSVL